MSGPGPHRAADATGRNGLIPAQASLRMLPQETGESCRLPDGVLPSGEDYVDQHDGRRVATPIERKHLAAAISADDDQAWQPIRHVGGRVDVGQLCHREEPYLLASLRPGDNDTAFCRKPVPVLHRKSDPEFVLDPSEPVPIARFAQAVLRML